MTRAASPQLISLLGSSTSFLMADLYTFRLQGGAVARYSAAATALTVGGVAFAKGPAFDRGGITIQVGTTVDELDLWAYPHINDGPLDPQPTDLLVTLNWYEAAQRGIFDDAIVQLERVFMPSYGDTSPGTIVLFVGRVSDVDVSRSAINFKVRSLLELLNVQMPRRLWQSPCTHVFGGAMCLYDRTLNQATIAALSGSLPGTINTSLVPSPTNLYDQGTIQATSGANLGFTRTITTLAGGIITVKPHFIFPVATGNTFLLLPGCDRSFNTCQNVYNNAIHFGGFPYIPVPETSV